LGQGGRQDHARWGERNSQRYFCRSKKKTKKGGGKRGLFKKGDVNGKKEKKKGARSEKRENLTTISGDLGGF